MSEPQPLLQVESVSRVYQTGETEFRALDDVSLEIHPGEFVAIMGQSGSGKSTLMNILGCLDRASAGRYLVNGHDVSELDDNALAELRRDVFGFVFQRYNLVPALSAAENVELPQIYAGRAREQRQSYARELLAKLGLGGKENNRPNELSGGQQQRVSIARALANEPAIILADEPTGALDSQTSEEVMALLRQFHAEGKTVLLITHEPMVAEHADRVIRILDGRIIEDSGRVNDVVRTRAEAGHVGNYSAWLGDFMEAVAMAGRSLRVNLFRTLLTLLGIVIGVGAVVAMMAIGNGSKQDVLERIQSMGANVLLVYPGGRGVRSSEVATLVPADAEALRDLPNIAGVSPERSTRTTLRVGRQDYQSSVVGVWPDYAAVLDWDVVRGSFITEDDVRRYTGVAVLGQTVAKNLFPDDPLGAVGSYVLIRNVPFEVIGILEAKGASAFGSDMDDTVLVPLSTGFVRLFGNQFLNSLRVEVADASIVDQTEAAVTNALRARHGAEDFQVRNTASLLETVEATQNTLTVMLGSVAAISLLVGGIGVMNIMLVSVTERTREIGIRKAVGARTGDIMLQFNTEAVVVCLIGGVLGVAAGFGAGLMVEAFGTRVVFSVGPALLAFSSAFIIGLLFGWLPARKAATLDPVVALASE